MKSVCSSFYLEYVQDYIFRFPGFVSAVGQSMVIMLRPIIVIESTLFVSPVLNAIRLCCVVNNRDYDIIIIPCTELKPSAFVLNNYWILIYGKQNPFTNTHLNLYAMLFASL